MTSSTDSSNQLSELLKLHPVLIVPGLHNSDEHHWQTRWQKQLPHSQRIRVDNWSNANLETWRNGILAQLDQIQSPAVLIAHSFGTLASASIAAEYPEKIAALFLAAPADPNKFGITEQLPQNFLSVPTKIIASSNDPWMSEHKAAYWALLWGADYLRIKNVGHINSQSNLGDWPQGIQELNGLIRNIESHTNSITQKRIISNTIKAA